jgi:hypothetical protein
LLHESLVDQQVLVKEAFVSGVLLEGLRDLVVPVANEEHHEVLLLGLQALVEPHDVIVLDDSAEGSLQLRLVLVVHGDADSQLGILLLHPAPGLDFGEKTSVLDLPHFAGTPEAARPYLAVQVTVAQGHALVGLHNRGLPVAYADGSHVHRVVLVPLFLQGLFSHRASSFSDFLVIS